MTKSVNGMQQSMRTLVDQAIAQRQAAEKLKQSYYADAVAKQQAAEAAKAAQIQAQAQQAQTQSQQAVSPLDDPESALSKLIAERGLTKEDYLKLNVAERQYDFADPILEQKWNAYVAANPDVAAQDSKQINKTKEAFFTQGRNLYSANFAAEEAKESGILSKAGNLAGDVVEGVAGLATAAGGLLKPVLGNDNVVSKGLTTAGEAGEEFGRGLASDAEQAREKYFYRLMEAGRYGDAAKFAAQNPMMLGGEALQMVAGTKGFGALTKGTAALSGKGLAMVGAEKAAQGVKAVGNAIGNSIPTYAGVSVGGEVANELASRGIDTTSPEGRLAVAMSFIGGAAASKITPHNIENQVAKWGLSKKAAQEVSRQAIADLEQLGIMKSAGKRLGGATKNLLKGAANEGAEEFMQEGLGAFASQALIGDDGKFRSWDEVPQDIKDQILRRATSGGLLGAALGGTTAGVVNGIAGGTHGDIQKNADYAASQAKYASEDAQKAAEEKARAEEETAAEAVRRAQAEEAQRAQEAEQAATEQATAAQRVAEQDDLLQELRDTFGAAAIDAKEVAANNMRKEYDDYLNAQFEAAIASPELSQEQKDAVQSSWNDGNRTLRAKANILEQLGVDVTPEQFSVVKNGKRILNNDLSKVLDYHAQDLTQKAQAKFDEAEVGIERLSQQGADEETLNALRTKLERARELNNLGAINSVLNEVKSSKVNKPSAKEAENTVRTEREVQFDDNYVNMQQTEVFKSLSRQEKAQLQGRITEDQEFIRKLQDNYADRLIKTGKASSKAGALQQAARTDLETLLSNHRPNKLSAKERNVYSRLPEQDGLWWTNEERALVKAAIDNLYKEIGILEPVDVNNLKASVQTVKVASVGTTPEQQAKAEAIVSAINSGTPIVLVKQAGTSAMKALKASTSLGQEEDFTGKSQAPSTGRQMRRVNAVQKHTTY